jgi:hypothetical protein
VHGLKDRQLHNDMRGFWRPGAVATIPTLTYESDISQTDLIARPRELALQPAAELFRRFGKAAPESNLRQMQDDLLQHLGWRAS